MIPGDVGIVDLLIGFPSAESASRYEFLKPLIQPGGGEGPSPVAYMFKDAAVGIQEGQDPLDVTLGEMDRYGIEIGLVMIGSLVGPEGDVAKRALKEHPTRFTACLQVDPNGVSEAVRSVREASAEYGIKAVSPFRLAVTRRSPSVTVATTRSTRRASTWPSRCPERRDRRPAGSIRLPARDASGRSLL